MAALDEKTRRVLQLEGQLARCENEKYALERQIMELKQQAKKRVKRRKT